MKNNKFIDVTKHGYSIELNPQKAPDCRYCIFYWNNAKDPDFRDTYYNGGWLEITDYDDNGNEKHFERMSTFRHSCDYFDVKVPPYQMPSSYIFRMTGKHCPIIFGNSKSHVKDNKTITTIKEKHEIDIKI